MIHEEALYQVYVPLPLPLHLKMSCIEVRCAGKDDFRLQYEI